MRRWIWAFLLSVCGLGLGLGRVEASGETMRVVEAITGETDGVYTWQQHVFYLVGTYTPAEEAFLTFCFFFHKAAYCVPENVRVLGVRLAGGDLTVNLSGALLQYGGCAYENALVAQCLRVAATIPGVISLTLLIDSLQQSLPEGTCVSDIPIPPDGA